MPLSRLPPIVIERLVRAAYEDPSAQSWPEPLEDLARAFGSTWMSADIYLDSMDAYVLRATNAGMDPSIRERYLSGDFHQDDPRTPRIIANAGAPLACWQLMPMHELERSRVVNDFLDKSDVDLRWSMSAGRMLPDGNHLVVAASRGRAKGRYEPEEVAAFSDIAGRMLHALTMHIQLADARRYLEFANTVKEGVALGIIGVDQAGRIVFSNSAAEAMLAAGKHVSSVRQRIQFIDQAAQRALERLLATPDGGVWRAHMPIGIEIYGIPAGTPEVGTRGLPPIKAVLWLNAQVDTSHVGLSEREREVVKLLIEGLSPENIAIRLLKSKETVRSQLKSAMRKFKVNSQAQLVRRFLSGRREWP